MYCEARNQSPMQLLNCFQKNMVNNATGANIAGCNREGASFSSLLPDESGSRTSTGSTPDKTAGAGKTIGTVSKKAWATVGLVAISSLAVSML
jgi:hypothetical protein